MRRLLGICAYIVFLLAFCLVQYELTQRSPSLWGAPWPGWDGAEMAERVTPWQPRTGVPPLDHLIHEGTEAAVYYRWLLRGSPDATLASTLEVRHHG